MKTSREVALRSSRLSLTVETTAASVSILIVFASLTA